MHGRSDGSPRWRRTLAAVAAAITIALLLGAAAGAAPATAAPTAITGGAGLDWGLKASWRTYIGEAGTTLSGGVTRNADGTFHFPVSGGSYEPDTGTTVVRFGGTVVFLGHCEGAGGTRPCALDLTLSDPRVEITEDGSFLYATIASRPIEGGEIRTSENIKVAALDTEEASPLLDATTTRWSDLPAVMTLEGSTVFTYSVGTVLDPVSFGYDGPGGKPAGEQWAEPATPAYARSELTAAAADARPRWTLPLADPDRLIGIHLGPAGLSVIDRRDFSIVPGSFTSDFSGAFSSVAVDPVSGTVFSGRSGADTTLRARHFDADTSSWVEETVDGSELAASSSVGGGAWDPIGRRYVVARAVGGDSQLWQVRQVAGVWTASNLGSVRQTNTLPAPLLQQLAVVPDGGGGSMIVASWFGQLQRLYVTADGVVADALAQAPGVTAAKLVPTRGGLYAINGDRVVWMPLGGYVWAPALSAAEPAISIPSPNGLSSLDTGFVAADYERDTIFVASHGLQRVTRIESGRVRHAFALPQLPRITYYATFLPGTTSGRRPRRHRRRDQRGGRLRLPVDDAVVPDRAAGRARRAAGRQRDGRRDADGRDRGRPGAGRALAVARPGAERVGRPQCRRRRQRRDDHHVDDPRRRAGRRAAVPRGRDQQRRRRRQRPARRSTSARRRRSRCSPTASP